MKRRWIDSLRLEREEAIGAISVKIAEANAILTRHSKRKSYELIALADVSRPLRVGVSDGVGGASVEISSSAFDRQFRSLKDMEEEEEEKETMTDGKVEGVRRRISTVTKDKVQAVLLDTIQLTSKLQSQLQEMQRKGGQFSPFL